jgi:hypothetical protein
MYFYERHDSVSPKNQSAFGMPQPQRLHCTIDIQFVLGMVPAL